MVINLLFKNTILKIKKSLGRYLSLFMIVLIGVGFYAGIQATVPDMITQADQYYKNHNLMDFKILSTMGLTDDDVSALKQCQGVKTVIPTYSLDVLDQEKTIRVHAIEDTVNTVKLVSGRMPQTDKECVADSKKYKIGDHILITSDVGDKLKNNEFTVVGTVTSVLYLADDYGSTTVGDGKLLSFIFVSRDNFILDAYAEIFIVADGVSSTAAYSKEYDSLVKPLRDNLIEMKPVRENARYQEIYNKAYQKISKNETKLNKEKAKGEKKLADAKAKLDKNAKKLAEGKEEIIKNEADLKKNTKEKNTEFDSMEAKIADGWTKINKALEQNGIQKKELDTKIEELDQAIGAMKAQLAQLPSDSQEYTQLNANISQYSASYQGLLQLKKSITNLTLNEAKLKEGIQTFHHKIGKAGEEIEKGKSEIAKNEEKLNKGYKKYNTNLEEFNRKISDAETKISNAKIDVSEIEKPHWYIFDRSAAIGYNELKSGIDVVASVAAVFPFFFLLIGMLMTSNSMARMVAEERSELGTMTSLGYKDGSIMGTYLFYVLSATGLGALAGFYIGCRVIPPLIFSNFKFILPKLVLQYNWMTFLLILLVTILIMTFVTILSCNKELKQEPAALMRPAPPKNGQTILLERIKPIWKLLSFSWKVTMRNMFRYKKRAFMTIVGVAGCTAFLLVGFGLRDSMNGVAQKQYGDIFRYEDMILFKDDTKKLSADLEAFFTKEQVEDPLLIRQNALKCEKESKTLDVYLIVPENAQLFNQYYHLKSKSDESVLELNDNSAIITQKVSEFYHAKKGDTIIVKDADNKEYRIKVSDVALNYTANYIYMNKVQYNQIFAKAASYNAVVSNHHTDQKTMAEHLMKNDKILNVIFTSDVLQTALDGSQSLNGVIILLVVVASLLAIIVLYNLTSINISERTREIATLKVLGFTDVEANGYIYREAFILTLLSIGVGLVMGIYLHRFVVDVIEGYATLFFRTIRWPSFLISSLLTILFSVIMQLVTYVKLRTIDMIESLKSVE